MTNMPDDLPEAEGPRPGDGGPSRPRRGRFVPKQPSSPRSPDVDAVPGAPGGQTAEEGGEPQRDLPHPWRLWVALAAFVLFLIVMWQFISGMENPDSNGAPSLLGHMAGVLNI